MRIFRPRVSVVVAFCILTVFSGPPRAYAQEIPACEGEGVAGTVVDVSGETVTIDTEDGLCAVTLVGGEYDHPIEELLGQFFGDVSPDHLTDAIETTHPCAVYDGNTDSYVWAACEAGSDAVPVTVVGQEGDSFIIIVMVDGVEVISTLHVEDADVAQRLSDALADLVVDWHLDDGGVVVQPGDQIAAYHDAGMGFGVILKLYAMAGEAQQACQDEGAGCDVTVESLVAAFQSGVGMGELFQLYGKPALLGIGHVRHYERRGAERAHVSDRVRASVQVVKAAKNVPNPKPEKNVPASGDTRPKTKTTGKPDQAGPKPKAETPGKPDHAGPKPKTKDKGD